MPPRETSIDSLDSIESRQDPIYSEPEQPKLAIQSKKKIKEQTVDEDEEEDLDVDNTPSKINDILKSSDTIILLVILLISMHPGINVVFNNYVKLGGFTFIVKALSVLGLYIILKYFV
jgi:hypothetical protein